MRIVECPVCGRRYRFDDSRMTKEKIGVKCRKCENAFVISRDMFPSPGPEASPPPLSMEKPPSPQPEDVHPMTLVIKKVPNETARLRVATRLMPITREKHSVLIRRLSKTPAIFHFEMTPSEGDNLLRAIESTGAKAEFSDTDVSRRGESRSTEDFPKRGWKRWVAAALLTFFLMIAGGLSYYIYREVRKTQVLEQRSFDSVFPAGAFLYVRLKDIEKNWQKIQEDPINRGLVSLVESLKSTPQVQNLLFRRGEWQGGMGVPFFGPNPMDFIGSDMRVALYAGNAPGAPHFVLTLKGNSRTKLMEILGKWLGPWQERLSPGQMDRGQKFYAFRPQGSRREIYFFSEGMVYIVSTSADLIRASTSLVGGDLPAKKSLRSVSLLSKKGERTGINQLGLFYVNPRNLTGSWFGTKGREDRTSFLKSLEAYGDVLGTISYGKGLVVESTMAVHREILDQPLRALLECPPAPNKTLAYVPGNTIVYASNTCFDLATYLSWLRKNLKKSPGFSIVLDRALHEVRAKTGVDIEKEILPYLGREFSYAIMGVNREGKVPFPGIQLFLEVKDRSKVKASIQKLLKKPVVRSWFKEAGVDLISMNYKKVPLTYLRYQGDKGLFFLSAFTPCYAFVDNFLVIGTGMESLKHTVDLSKGRGVSMLKDRRFNAIKRLFRGESNGVAYADLRATSRLLRDLVTQGPLAGFAGSGGEKTQKLEAFLPVLETLNYIWTEAEFKGDRVRFLVYVAL